MLGLLVLLLCPLTGYLRRRELASADALCRSIAIGTPLPDATRAFASAGATELSSMTAPRQDVAYGIRGDLVSWQCTLDLDDARTVVRRARFTWWIPPDFHGGWDDDAHGWLEQHFY